MKKHILFIMDSFPMGGIAKSLLSLINILGKEKYKIDILLMSRTGELIGLIPKNVRILDEPLPQAFRNPHPKNILKNLSLLNFKLWSKWVKYSLFCTLGRIKGGLFKQVQNMDYWIGKNSPEPSKVYDAAIAYQGGRCIYYLIEKVNAKIKIGYVHSDYLNNATDYMLYPIDRLYFPRLNWLVTISNNCADSLKKRFPEISSKIKVVENICSPTLIHNMSQQLEVFNDSFDGIRIMTLGRLDWEVKGLDFVVETCRILKSKGIKFRWYLLGDGHGRGRVEDSIERYNLNDQLHILGFQENPYAYIRKCDIYVHPSRVEGKSVALDEVKALSKPIVVTNFSTVFDQFEDKKNALICNMDADSISEKIIELISDTNLRNRLVENLKNEKVGNEEQALIFESLVSE